MAPMGYVTPRLAREQDPTPHDIIWAAGFFEGDGTCTSDMRTTYASISQKDRWVLDRMRSLFGGAVSFSQKEHSTFRWRVSGARARGFLQSIYELESPRRQEQIRRALNHG